QTTLSRVTWGDHAPARSAIWPGRAAQLSQPLGSILSRSAPMNRRSFLATSAAAATLAASQTVSAQGQASGSGRARVLIPNTPADQLAELKAAAPAAELVVCQNEEEALKNVEGAHASYGFITARMIRAGKDLRWVQQPSAGVEQLMEIPEL